VGWVLTLVGMRVVRVRPRDARSCPFAGQGVAIAFKDPWASLRSAAQTRAGARLFPLALSLCALRADLRAEIRTC
jgi:hypothetical protein